MECGGIAFELLAFIHNRCNSQRKRRLNVGSGVVPMHQLWIYQHTILFLLRTDHRRLLSHLQSPQDLPHR